MFNNISPAYDSLNRMMTFRLDIRWRKNVVKIVEKNEPQNILDIATGTGDLAIALAKIQGAHITGVDISEGMLAVARQKVAHKNLEQRIDLALADSEALPFADNSFDAVTVSFGVRNFENLALGLKEIYRVLRPNGVLVILETSVPTRFPLKQGYALYTHYFLPFLGSLFSKNRKAYAYLSESAHQFPFGEKFAHIIAQAGFSYVSFSPQTLGVATIYTAYK